MEKRITGLYSVAPQDPSQSYVFVTHATVISRWLLKLHVTKCLLNGSYIGLREPKLLSIVRSSEKLMSLVRTIGLFCGDTCFQMSLGSNSFHYEDFHAYLVSGRFWDYSNIFMYGVEKIQKCFIYISEARDRGGMSTPR